MRAILAVGLLLAASSMAQAATLNGATWAEPEEITVSYDARLENGQVVRDPQTFTLHWDFELDCTPGTEPGDVMEIFAANTGRIAVQEGGESWTIFDLEPKSFNVSWEQSSPVEPWTTSGSMEITIINEQASDIDRNVTYYWAANPWISDACQGGQEISGTLDFRNHTILLPGIGAGEPLEEESEPQTTPGPAVPLMVLALAVLVLRKK